MAKVTAKGNAHSRMMDEDTSHRNQTLQRKQPLNACATGARHRGPRRLRTPDSPITKRTNHTAKGFPLRQVARAHD